MSAEHFHRDNHYVSQAYLKRWTSSQKRLWVYRVLASHTQVPAWKEASVKGVAYHSHLYTRIAEGRETDDFEKWLDREYEAPAEEPLAKATANARLTPDDWKRLVRFVAAQDIRTPARLVETSQWWNQTLPGILDHTLRDIVRKLGESHDRGEIAQQEPAGETEFIPLRVTREIKPGHDVGQLMAEVVVGRSVWLFSMRHLLKKTVSVLPQHKWTILSALQGIHWITGDDPVIKLNFTGPACMISKAVGGTLEPRFFFP